MTKKDYVKFADMIAENKANIDLRTNNDAEFSCGMIHMLATIRDEMIQLFKSDNPNFDASRFNDYIENKVKQILDSVQ